MTRAQSAHLWTVKYIFILVGLGNAQHLSNVQHFSEFHKIMYKGVAFTLERMGLIPSKISSLSKVFFKSYLCLVLSTDTARGCTKSSTKTYQKNKCAPKQEAQQACTVFLHGDFPSYSLPGWACFNLGTAQKAVHRRKKVLTAQLSCDLVQKVSGENLLRNCVPQHSFFMVKCNKADFLCQKTSSVDASHLCSGATACSEDFTKACTNSTKVCQGMHFTEEELRVQ